MAERSAPSKTPAVVGVRASGSWLPGLKASHTIISVLRGDIASGRLPRNSRLPNEKELATKFGVSQPTVREALRALDAMGLIEVRHGSGAYVAGDTRNLITRSLQTLLQVEGVGILEVLELRAILGERTAELAAVNATEDDIVALANARDAINTAAELPDMWEAVISFQVLFSVAAHSPLNFAMETFLAELIMQFQIDAFEDSGEDFWRLWISSASEDRDRIVSILQEGHGQRDAEQLKAAMNAYLGTQRSLFANNARLSQIVMSDPSSIDAVSSPRFQIPDYRTYDIARKAGA